MTLFIASALAGHLLQPGEQLSPSVAPSAEGTWLGLYETDSGSELREVEVRVDGLTVEVDGPAPLILLRDESLTVGPVETAWAGFDAMQADDRPVRWAGDLDRDGRIEALVDVAEWDEVERLMLVE
jgi:hypothetical protein